MEKEVYPRVLFVTPCAFNNITGGGITFSNLFQGWPGQCLATVTGDNVPVSMNICNQYYFLSSRELNYIRPLGWFYKRKSKKQDLSSSSIANPVKSRSRELAHIVKFILGDAGIPDRGVLSPQLRQWIKEYKPDIIYTILGTKGYIELVAKIQEEFNLPAVVHFMDEGVTAPKKNGIFGLFIRIVYKQKLRALVRRTKSCIAICDEMAEAYQKRFGRNFSAFQNVVDLEKWQKYIKSDFCSKKTFKILYSGSILSCAQLQSLTECCQAVEKLIDEGVKIELDIYTPISLLEEDGKGLFQYKGVNVYDTIAKDEDFFRTLGEADLLLLPVNFDFDSKHYIRYSMPTKIPAYLASGTPIFVYGPHDIAQVKYACMSGWGYVVSTQGVEYIKEALCKLKNDEELRKKLSVSARTAVIKNHDSNFVRAKFQALLRDSAHTLENGAVLCRKL